MLKHICDILRYRVQRAGRQQFEAMVALALATSAGLEQNNQGLPEEEEQKTGECPGRGKCPGRGECPGRGKCLTFCKAEAECDWAHGLLFKQLSGKVLFYFVLYLALKKVVILTFHNYIIKA